jgi:choline-sulfatase
VSRPNVLLIVSDEHNHAVSGFSGDKLVQTPNLDAIADRGIRFDNAFCQSPVCTPSRMSFLTGKNIRNCGVWNNHWVLRPEHRSMADSFSDSGYATCLVGKMHFGGGLQYHGFQQRPYGDLKHGLGHQPDPIDMFPNSGGVLHAGPSEIPESLQQEVVVSVESAAWIENHIAEKPEQPWFVCASYNKPHAPLVCPPRYFNRYLGKVPSVWIDDRDVGAKHPFVVTHRRKLGLDKITPEQNDRARAAYWGAVNFLDDCIGMMLDRLDSAGVLDNTLVVYLSDHGDMIGNHGLWWKAIFYDESIRVPFIMAGPGIEAGRVEKGLAALTDLYPTLCSLAGVQGPESIDGVDLTPLLKDGTPCRDHIISEYYGMGVVTHAEGKAPSGNNMRMIRTEKHKYVNTPDQGDFLFDLESDPEEFENRIDDRYYASHVAQLKNRLCGNVSWKMISEQMISDKEKAARYRSGLRPTTPNQYQMADGRTFDAESSLYDARWLEAGGEGIAGIIPQMRH